jgi:hypothetical protein
MKTWALALAILLALLLSSCGPTAAEIATMTAAAWTPTPPPTPTATPIPYDLTVHIADESGAPVPGASIVIMESGSDRPVQVDASGVYTWNGLPGAVANLEVTAPGYFPVMQSLTLERGPTEMALILSQDPFGLLPADACAADEKLLYIEDFQDGKAQGWPNLTAAVEFNAQNGWAIGPKEEGNEVAAFAGPHEDLADLDDFVFDNFVWRLRVQTQGTDGFSFLDLRRAPKEGGETRYTVQWGASPLLALARLDFPDVGHFDVATSTLQLIQGQWYYLEMSYFQGLVQVWVDGEKILEYQDPQPMPPGTISLEAHVPNDPNTAYYFDDLSVCELSAPFATTMYTPPAE